eukprot:TRINITY_DN9438_c0_g2_i2.p1 TRINITY_DN9438_c0_g2~~TRINITY_DN9438_c0_g2_i2.p1  ORF type:complete len:839 (+),score=235.45 TRINITY_DN9438_c0_g2_i2:187-2703(+)
MAAAAAVLSECSSADADCHASRDDTTSEALLDMAIAMSAELLWLLVGFLLLRLIGAQRFLPQQVSWFLDQCGLAGSAASPAAAAAQEAAAAAAEKAGGAASSASGPALRRGLTPSRGAAAGCASREAEGAFAPSPAQDRSQASAGIRCRPAARLPHREGSEFAPEAPGRPQRRATLQGSLLHAAQAADVPQLQPSQPQVQRRLPPAAGKAAQAALVEEAAAAPARPSDTQSKLSFLRAASRNKDMAYALALLEEFKAESPSGLDVSIYNCALDVCVTQGDGHMAEALALFKEMQQSSVPNLVTYNTLAKGYCLRGQLSQARAVLQQIADAGLTPDSASFNCLVNAAISAGDVRLAWDMIDEMERRGVKIDCYTVSIMMTAAKKAKDGKEAERALSILDRARDVSPVEDDILFNTVLDACIQRRDKRRLARVVRTFEEPLAVLGPATSSSASRASPSVHTYGLLIKACSLLERVDKCHVLWREMTGKGIQPNQITLSCMIDALVCAGQAAEALRLFRKWQPTIPANTVIYATLIKGCASTGDAHGAVALYKELKEKGLRMNTVAFTTLINAQVKAGDMARAEELLRAMDEDGCAPNHITYSTLIRGYCFQGDLQASFDMLQEMLGRGLPADAVVINTMLNGCVRMSRFDVADRLVDNMSEYGVKPSNHTLSILLKMWARRRQLDRAFEAVRTLPARHGFHPDAQVGSCLVSACFQCGSTTRAIEAWKQVRLWPGQQTPDVSIYKVFLDGLRKQARKQEDWRLALEVAEEALDKHHMFAGDGCLAETLQQLAQSLRTVDEELSQRLRERIRAAQLQEQQNCESSPRRMRSSRSDRFQPPK